MTPKRPKSTERKQRSDGRQNRERILTVAKEAFTKSGANASLEDIAKQAGVGPGTLYRHFSSREELLKVVYNAVTEKLAKAQLFVSLQKGEDALFVYAFPSRLNASWRRTRSRTRVGGRRARAHKPPPRVRLQCPQPQGQAVRAQRTTGQYWPTPQLP
jgi:AcrR family transcriptional regulator